MSPPSICYYFKNGWDRRLRAVAQPAFEEYLRRNPPSPGARGPGGGLDCP